MSKSYKMFIPNKGEEPVYKKLTIFITALIVMSVLVACTPETIIETVEVEVPGETIYVEVPAESEEVDETGPRSITFFTTEADPPQLEILGEIIDEYNEMHPEVFIDVVTGTPATRGNRITTLLAAGADAGIFELEAAYTNEWTEAGYLLPLTDVFENIGGVDEYVPGSYFEKDGDVYGLPYATSVYGLWIRTDLFEDAGLAPPTNYAEVLAAAEALTNPAEGIYGISIPGATNASVNLFATLLWNQCGDFYTPQGELIFDSPEALEAVKNWVALAEYAPPGFESYSWGDQVTAFITGNAAMSVYAGRMGPNMSDKNPELEPVSDIIQLPWSVGEGDYVTYGSWSRMAISAGTKYPETAKDFLQFMLSGDRLARYDATVIGHMVPPTKEVASMLENWDSEYANNHSDWLAFFNENAEFTNHPANNMGSVVGCKFDKQEYGPPWGGPVFSRGGIIDIMFQNIYVGDVSVEDAHAEAIVLMKEAQEEWLTDHPDWTPPSP